MDLFESGIRRRLIALCVVLLAVASCATSPEGDRSAAEPPHAVAVSGAGEGGSSFCDVDPALDAEEPAIAPEREVAVSAETGVASWRLTTAGVYGGAELNYPMNGNAFSRDGRWVMAWARARTEGHTDHLLLSTDGATESDLRDARFWPFGVNPTNAHGSWARDSQSYYPGNYLLELDIHEELTRRLWDETDPSMTSFAEAFYGADLSPDGQYLLGNPSEDRDGQHETCQDRQDDGDIVTCANFRLRLFDVATQDYWEARIPFKAENLQPQQVGEDILSVDNTLGWLGNDYVYYITQRVLSCGGEYQAYCNDYCAWCANDPSCAAAYLLADGTLFRKESFALLEVDRDGHQLEHVGYLEVDIPQAHCNRAVMGRLSHLEVSPEAYYFGPSAHAERGLLAGYDYFYGVANSRVFELGHQARRYRSVYGHTVDDFDVAEPYWVEKYESPTEVYPYRPSGSHSALHPTEPSTWLAIHNDREQGRAALFDLEQSSQSYFYRHTPVELYQELGQIIEGVFLGSNPRSLSGKPFKYPCLSLAERDDYYRLSIYYIENSGRPYAHWSPDGTKVAVQTFSSHIDEPEAVLDNLRQVGHVLIRGGEGAFGGGGGGHGGGGHGGTAHGGGGHGGAGGPPYVYLSPNALLKESLETLLASEHTTVGASYFEIAQADFDTLPLPLSFEQMQEQLLDERSAIMTAMYGEAIWDPAVWLAVYRRPDPPTELAYAEGMLRWQPAAHHNEIEGYEIYVFDAEQGCAARPPIVHAERITHLRAEGATGQLAADATTIEVDSTEGFPPEGYLEIEAPSPIRDSEIVAYASKTDTSFESCTRGADGSSPSVHWNDALVWSSTAHHGVFVGELPPGSSVAVRAMEWSGLKSELSEPLGISVSGEGGGGAGGGDGGDGGAAAGGGGSSGGSFPEGPGRAEPPADGCDCRVRPSDSVQSLRGMAVLLLGLCGGARRRRRHRAKAMHGPGRGSSVRAVL